MAYFLANDSFSAFFSPFFHFFFFGGGDVIIEQCLLKRLIGSLTLMLIMRLSHFSSEPNIHECLRL